MRVAASFEVDRKLLETLEELRAHFNWPSREEALRKSVSLLKIVSENEDPDGSITLRKGPSSDFPVEGHVTGDVKKKSQLDLKIMLR